MNQFIPAVSHSKTPSNPAQDGAAKRLLGNTAKSSSPQQEKSPTKDARAVRYQALSQARQWLMARAKKIDPEKMPGDLFRTIDCRWSRRSPEVGVHFTALHQRSHYSGVATCGSVWACPICCAVIQQRRRAEVSQLIEWVYSKGLEAAMVTLTFPHTSFDHLGDLLSKQREAFRRLRSGSVWQDFKKQHGYLGLVRSLEVTLGKTNGYHPHTHELWITEPMHKSVQAAFLDFIKTRWLKACAAAGLIDLADKKKVMHFLVHAVDVKHKASNSDYLAKQDSSRAWGVDREIATGSSKIGKTSRAGNHPHTLLVDGFFDDLTEHQRAGKFIEYAQGMKGQRQLYWSTGLKALAGIEDKTDETLADESQTPSDLLGNLTSGQWLFVRANDCRAELLTAAESHGWPGVARILHALGIALPGQ